jgi:putative ABC transport system substrate-binding protein
VTRRVVLALLAAAIPAWGQRPARPWRIGYISLRPGPNEFDQAFLRGLRERGYAEGTNLVIDFRWAGGDAQRHRAGAAEVVSQQPDIIVVADGSGAVRTIRELSPNVPIVVPAAGDMIAQGLTRSFARPDNNVTGISVLATELSQKRLELLKETVPDLRRAGALFNAARRENPPLGVAASVTAGRQLGIEVLEMPVTLPDGVNAAYASAVRQGVQGVMIVSDIATITHRAPLCDLALRHRLPTIFANRSYLHAGGLLSYGPDLEGAFHRGAYYVDRIFKGTKPADLPIEQPSELKLTLNLKTARAIGLTFPQAMLLRADEVILTVPPG